MAMITLIKYLLLLTVFFYGTMFVDFMRNTSYTTLWRQNMTTDSNFYNPTLILSLRKSISRGNILERNFNEKELSEWKLIQKGKFANLKPFDIDKSKIKLVEQLVLKNDDFAKANNARQKESFLMKWSTRDEIKLQSTQIRSNKKHSFQQVGNNIYVFSAFFDNRQLAVHNESLIRIVTIAKLDSNETLICKTHISHRELIVKAVRTEMSDNHAKLFGGVLFSCKIPAHFGKTPPKVVYLQNVNSSQTASFSKTTDKLISLPEVQLELFRPKENRKGVKINSTSTGNVNFRNSEHSSQYKPDKILQQNRQKLKDSININNSQRKERKAGMPTIESQLLKSTTVNGKQGKQLQNQTLKKLPSNMELIPLVSVCVSPVFGSVKLIDIIQFIEMHLILGVHHFFLYKMDISKEVEQILNTYKSRGVVTVLNWTLPAELQSSSNIWYNAQVAAQQDCLYRNIGHATYTAFLDLDEIIVPYDDTTWTELLQRTEKSEQQENATISHFIFKSAFFPPDVFEVDTQVQRKSVFNKFPILKSVYRNTVISSVRTKVIVKPDYIELIGIHHISKQISAAKQLHSVSINTSSSLIHHYRKCTQVSDVNMRCGNYIRDTSLLKYADKLLDNYEMVINDFITQYNVT